MITICTRTTCEYFRSYTYCAAEVCPFPTEHSTTLFANFDEWIHEDETLTKQQVVEYWLNWLKQEVNYGN